MNEEEELNLDDIFDVPRAQYEINRQRQQEYRNLNPDRFQDQVQTTKKAVGDFATGVVEDLSTPRGITEFR